MNNHTIHGRLVRDPELTPRKNSDGSDRVNFTVATDRRYGDEAVHSYEGKDGVKRKSYSIFVEGFDFCGSKNDSSKGKNDSGDNWEKQQEDIPF